MNIDKKIGITIPCHWNKEVVNQIIIQNNEIDGPKVVELYGSLPEGGPVGHGRSSETVQKISKEGACEFVSYLHENGLDFTYLLNAPFHLRDEEHKIEIDNYIKWIINDLRPDAVTIASPELMRIVREISSNIPIHISTIAGVRNATDLDKFLKYKPNRLVPHHDCGKEFSNLIELIRISDEHNIELELLSTESCLRKCPNREAHYEYLAKKTKDISFHTKCNTKKIENPSEFLLSGGVIRPEDIDYYANLGIKYFKISGRSKNASWLPEVVKAYQHKNYDGNLIRLLGIDPKIEAEKWIYIDNKALDGFIEKYPRDDNYQNHEQYCNEWIIKLFKDGKFYLNDGTEYIIENDRLLLKNIGNIAEETINKEVDGGIKIH